MRDKAVKEMRETLDRHMEGQTVLGAMRQRLEALDAEAKQALGEYDRGRSRLYLRVRVNGSVKEIPKADPAAIARVEEELRSHRATELRRIRRQAEALWREGISELELAQEFPTDRALSSAERSEAAERVPFAESELATLHREDLERRMRGVLKNGTNAERFVYLQAGKKRAEQMRHHQVESYRSRATNRDQAVPSSVRITPIDGVLGDLEESLVGEERRSKVERVRAVLDYADSVMRSCYTPQSPYHRPANPITDPEEAATAHGGGTIAR